MTVRTPHRVTILVDGRRVTRVSTAPSVRDLLREAKIAVGSHDVVEPAQVVYPLDGQTVTVSRVYGKRIVLQVAVPYRTIRRADPTLFKGETSVRRPGEPGLVVKTYAVTYVNSKATEKHLLRSKSRARPVDEIVAFGTRAVPTGGGPVTIPATGGLDWARLAQCESGGRPRAVGGGGLYFGLYQFDLSTWHAWGGQGNPIDASPAEQTMRAQMLYNNRGRAPWPICGRYL